MSEFPPFQLAVDASSKDPLYRQVYTRFRVAIAQGLLKPGDRIPSARALAKELGLARGTIEAAYALLSAEGYVRALGQAGTIITPDLSLPVDLARPCIEPVKQVHTVNAAFGGSRLDETPALGEIPPFMMGVPAMDAFPRKLWARLGARQLRSMHPAAMNYPSLYGLWGLRQAIAAYLLVARGIHCSGEQVFITSGYRDTVHFLIQALLKPGDRVWVEDPGYLPTRELLCHAGLQAIPIPVDADGIVVQRGVEVDATARAVVVTPAHQSPLCLSMTLPRRLELLDWAEQKQAWIIEDDYDGEYRYTSRPLPALKSLDRQGRVLYAGTFSKVLFPGARVAYLVVPDALVECFRQTRRVSAPGIPALTQEIVTAFIDEGHFGRHIHRMRLLYADRRKATAAGLENILGAQMRVVPQPGGMHLVMQMQGEGSDLHLAQKIRQDGMFAHALSEWAISSPVEPALLLSFTNIPTQQRAEELAKRILTLV